MVGTRSVPGQPTKIRRATTSVRSRGECTAVSPASTSTSDPAYTVCRHRVARLGRMVEPAHHRTRRPAARVGGAAGALSGDGVPVHRGAGRCPVTAPSRVSVLARAGHRGRGLGIYPVHGGGWCVGTSLTEWVMKYDAVSAGAAGRTRRLAVCRRGPRHGSRRVATDVHRRRRGRGVPRRGRGLRQCHLGRRRRSGTACLGRFSRLLRPRPRTAVTRACLTAKKSWLERLLARHERNSPNCHGNGPV